MPGLDKLAEGDNTIIEDPFDTPFGDIGTPDEFIQFINDGNSNFPNRNLTGEELVELAG